MAFENFPYTNFHEINLDWIVARVKEAYSASNPPDYPVKSVNGMTGDVIIAIPANLVSSVNGETGDVVLYRNPLTQFPSTDEQRWNLFRICDGYERGIEFDEDGAHRIEGTRRILIYDAENQPDFPVTSVNGQTGDVRISAGVNSVNGKTGNVVTPFVNPNTDILKLDSNSNTILWGISRDVAGGNVALYITSGGGSPQAFIRFTPTEGEAINLPLLTNADIPESAGVVSINGKTGVVTLTASDIAISIENATKISEYLENQNTKIDNLYNELYTDTPDVSLWEQGGLSAASAEDTESDTRIRTKTYINENVDRIYSTSADITLRLYAWNNLDVFIGIWVDSDKFAKRWYDAAILTDIDLSVFRQRYPNYKFRVIAVKTDDAAIAPADAAYIEFSKPKMEKLENDFTALSNTVNTFSGDIASLKTSRDENNQQISALQAKDTTHDQQIAALQAKDITHDQQIAELQSADATINNTLNAFNTTLVTHDQQINELYTRTGIYAIFIENVNSLPLRYPATGTDAKIKNTNVVVSMDLYVSGVQVDDWTITTYDGYLEITGTMNGVSSLTLYLA